MATLEKLLEEIRITENSDFSGIREKISRMCSASFNNETSNYDELNYVTILIVAEREIMYLKGKMKSYVENDIFIAITMFLHSIYEKTEMLKCELDDNLTKSDDSDLYNTHLLSLQIFALVKEILVMKVPRDNFSSKRKILALELLNILLGYYEIQNRFYYYRLAIESRKNNLIAGAFDLLESYIESSNDILPNKLTETIMKIVNRTKDRSVLVCGLKVLIAIGEETEFGALDKVDAWKEKYEW